MEDRWMSKTGIEKTCDISAEEEGLCPSMYSFHSSPEEKNKFLFSLTQYGLETTVDRSAKKDRIRQWIQSSVIEEEDENFAEEDDSEEDLHIKDIRAGPVGERVNRGPVTTENGTPKKSSMKKYGSTLSLRKEPDIYKPPIDPRIPLELQRSKSAAIINHTTHYIPPQVSTSLTGSGNIPIQKGSTVRINESVTVIGQNSISLQSIKITPESPPYDVKTNGNFDYNSYGNGSLTNNNSIKHSINIQVPQAEQYDYNGYGMHNGSNGTQQRMYKTVSVSSPTGRKKSVSSERHRSSSKGRRPSNR